MKAATISTKSAEIHTGEKNLPSVENIKQTTEKNIPCPFAP
jgi:hypothetical protein